MISYELKVNFAIIFSLISLFLWFYERHKKKKQDRIEAYETIYDDVLFLINYPLKVNKGKLKKIKYKNPNKKLEKAVREYLNSHFYDRLYFHSDIYLNDSNIDNNKMVFVDKVKKEADKFNFEILDKYEQLKTPYLSPVYYINNHEIKIKMDNILRQVGRNLTKFNNEIRYCWSSTHYHDPKDILNEYEKGMRVCPNFYEHNPKDLSDPYYDILIEIQKQYQKLTRKKYIYLKDKFILKKDIFKYRIRDLIKRQA